jgi:hypothetical protein
MFVISLFRTWRVPWKKAQLKIFSQFLRAPVPTGLTADFDDSFEFCDPFGPFDYSLQALASSCYSC